jgi:hypothetical protein
MKLIDTITLSLAVVFLLIGIDLVLTLGFGGAYWSLMLALTLFFLYAYRKKVKNN